MHAENKKSEFSFSLCWIFFFFFLFIYFLLCINTDSRQFKHSVLNSIIGENNIGTLITVKISKNSENFGILDRELIFEHHAFCIDGNLN
jgi:hypothetical protein